jgi:hypothetical protein
MPAKKTVARAREDIREGKRSQGHGGPRRPYRASPSFRARTQAAPPKTNQTTEATRSPVNLIRSKCGHTHHTPNSSAASHTIIITSQTTAIMTPATLGGLR